MKIFRYWVKHSVRLYSQSRTSFWEQEFLGKSNISEADAVRDAEAVGSIIQSFIDFGKNGEVAADYESPIREEVLEEIIPGNVVTRNYYGAEILNTESLIFADVDYKCFEERYVPGFFGRLFGKKEESEREYRDRIYNSILNLIKEEWIRNSHIRVYKTHSGYRILFAGLNMKAGDQDCCYLLSEMNSDPLYIYLCEKQNCCRARLTPKPYRIHLNGIRLKVPYSQEVLPKIRDWIQSYRQASENYAVCRLVRTFGPLPSDDDLAVIEYHDKKCKVDQNLPLA